MRAMQAKWWLLDCDLQEFGSTPPEAQEQKKTRGNYVTPVPQISCTSTLHNVFMKHHIMHYVYSLLKNYHWFHGSGQVTTDNGSQKCRLIRLKASRCARGKTFPCVPDRQMGMGNKDKCETSISRREYQPVSPGRPVTVMEGIPNNQN